MMLRFVTLVSALHCAQAFAPFSSSLLTRTETAATNKPLYMAEDDSANADGSPVLNKYSR